MAERRVAKTYRLPVSLVERVERYAERMQREAPAGVRVSVTGAIIFLLTHALDQLEGSSGRAG